jgi:hypothetical protein
VGETWCVEYRRVEDYVDIIFIWPSHTVNCWWRHLYPDSLAMSARTRNLRRHPDSGGVGDVDGEYCNSRGLSFIFLT